MTASVSTKLTVDEQLCFALYSASRAVTGRYRDGLNGLGLTYSQYVVMMVLWEHGTVTMGQLGAELHLDSGTLSPLLKRLASQGLVTRRRSAEDERTLEVSCTEQGRSLREGAVAVQAEVERATGLSPSELARLRTDLHGLAARLRADEGDASVG